MIAALLNIPRSPEDWQRWSFANSEAIATLRGALAAQGVTIPDLQIDPINPAAPDLFLQNNSQLHQAITGALGLQSTDLLDVDLQDPNQLAVWIFQNHQDLYDAANRLGVG